ncbi:MAG: radical SAM protein [Pseudomonadota bacterium]|nr:radical SAM protein [Pseudomonadota bacterium]
MADGTIHNAKFQDPAVTADGKERASVSFDRLETLWVNTGTLCNVQCAHCYIESSPANDRLDYLTADDLAPFLDEAESLGAREIGFTGGEPFMNAALPAMLLDCLARGFATLVLTNAMRPMMRPKMQAALLALRAEFAAALTLRVSLDHYAPALHDAERGPAAFEETAKGVDWLAAKEFRIAIAGRLRWGESEDETRAGYARLFAERGWPLDAQDPSSLVLFPEMDERANVPEITTECWDILKKDPRSVMCASSRMLIKRKDAARPVVLACTLIPYSAAFEMGDTLTGALGPVRLNHPHCAKFCVLGGASCSA